MDKCKSCSRLIDGDSYRIFINLGFSPIEAAKHIDRKLNMSDAYKEINSCCQLEYVNYKK